MGPSFIAQKKHTRHGAKGNEDEFVQTMIKFGEGYGEIVRSDYSLFYNAFRNHLIPG